MNRRMAIPSLGCSHKDLYLVQIFWLALHFGLFSGLPFVFDFSCHLQSHGTFQITIYSSALTIL